MSKPPRKGLFQQPAPSLALFKPPLTKAAAASEQPTNVLSSDLIYKTFWKRNADSVAEPVSIDLSDIAREPLLAANIEIIATIFRNVSPTTARGYRKRILAISQYTRWYRQNFKSAPASASECTSHFTNYFVLWQIERGIGLGQKSSDTQMFRRVIAALGVPLELLPVNPFPFNGMDDVGAADTLSTEELRSLLNQAKFEARVVIDRTREAHRLAAKGSDPRRSAGARNGSWEQPENRAYVIKRVLGRRIEKFDDMRFRLGHRTLLAGLENQPAAKYVDDDGSVSRQRGWNGHLRWFFPWPEDILPFALLLMIRTGWNLSTATSIQSRRWSQPFPFPLTADNRDGYAYVVGYKSRSKTNINADAKTIRVPSSKRPWSHAYRVLKFVEYLTAGLRREIHRRQKDLELRFEDLNRDEKSELARLNSIANDLFIFKTEQGISSLRWHTQRQGYTFARQLAAFGNRCSVKFNFRDLRDARILHSYEASDKNVSVAQMIADHSDSRVTERYLRRSRTLQRVWKNAIEVFNSSLKLIETGTFSSAQLKSTLTDQGFSEFQSQNLLETGAETIWGNRCADLKNPPAEFAAGHQSGHTCVAQDCIDGCPHARWFDDSVDHVARQLALAEIQHAQLGLESTMLSSHQSRIDRLHRLLSLWPSSRAQEALQAARAEVVPTQGNMGTTFAGANP